MFHRDLRKLVMSPPVLSSYVVFCFQGRSQTFDQLFFFKEAEHKSVEESILDSGFIF